MNKTSKAQIIATIGPSSKERDILYGMIQHQMDVARLNFSWGTYDEHRQYTKDIRELAEVSGKIIPIIQDLSGPRVQSEDGHHIDNNINQNSKASIITYKDIADLEFGAEMNFEYVAMSYVGDENDIFELKDKMKDFGYKAKIIAKIERSKALRNLDAIIKASDAIMIARGDLGNEVPIEQIPFIQFDIIKRVNKTNKPVIVATEMMSSMIDQDRPSRADVTDVSQAILSGADCVMLSDETANGKYPVEAVSYMEKIIIESEEYSKEEFNCL